MTPPPIAYPVVVFRLVAFDSVRPRDTTRETMVVESRLVADEIKDMFDISKQTD
jgi:uncharacterized protein YbaA (DUF1428 family)